ncbi:hypothetical protein CDAR_254771 [Caerostris darwini]|uniref:Uncharacterized protein n=1 Tax=Caerostris darwini TaxID=1538125 RepID=A0AAV4TCR3_9ARAC|nr:hypothetical protein CDAR_254771 [Caerostris darwini]
MPEHKEEKDGFDWLLFSPYSPNSNVSIVFCPLSLPIPTYLSPLKKSLPYQSDTTERKTSSYEAHHHTTTLPSYNNLAHNITSLTQNSYQPLFRTAPKRAGKNPKRKSLEKE